MEIVIIVCVDIRLLVCHSQLHDIVYLTLVLQYLDITFPLYDITVCYIMFMPCCNLSSSDLSLSFLDFRAPHCGIREGKFSQFRIADHEQIEVWYDSIERYILT